MCAVIVVSIEKISDNHRMSGVTRSQVRGDHSADLYLLNGPLLRAVRNDELFRLSDARWRKLESTDGRGLGMSYAP